MSLGMNRLFPVSILTSFIQTNKIPHLLVLVGDPVITTREARRFVTMLMMPNTHLEYTIPLQHPDVIELIPEGVGSMYPVERLRRLINDLPFYPVEGERCIVILHAAERLLETGCNTLLKVLEEPPSRCHFLFLTQYPALLIPTVLSRSQLVSCSEHPSLPSCVERLLDVLTRDQGARLAQQMITLYREEETAERMRILLMTLLRWYRDVYYYAFGQTHGLYFPERVDGLQKHPVLCLQKVQEILQQAQHAYDLSCKVEPLFMSVVFQLSRSKMATQN